MFRQTFSAWTVSDADYYRSFASFFWPRQGVNYQKLMDIHSKLAKETSPAPKKAKRKGDGAEASGKKRVKKEVE